MSIEVSLNIESSHLLEQFRPIESDNCTDKLVMRSTVFAFSLIVNFHQALNSIIHAHLEPIKEEVATNKQNIFSLQQETAKNKELIIKLQQDSLANKESLERLNELVLLNSRLQAELQKKVQKHNELIALAIYEIVKNQKFSEQLEKAILLNKERINQVKQEQDSTQKMQQIFIKYANNPDGISAFHYAIKKGDRQAVSLFVKNGADVNARDNQYTALHCAIRNNQLEIANDLLDRGADVNAIRQEYHNQWLGMHFAAQVGNKDMISLLVARGANVNKNLCCDPNNSQNVTTPLHLAAQLGHLEAVKALVNSGANINSQSSSGPSDQWYWGSPLDWAAHNLKYSDDPNNLELIKFLVENGAERKCRTNNKYSKIIKICPVIDAYLASIRK